MCCNVQRGYVGEYAVRWRWQGLLKRGLQLSDLVPKVTVTVKHVRLELERTGPEEWSSAEATVKESYIAARLALANQLTALLEGSWFSLPNRIVLLTDAVFDRVSIDAEDVSVKLRHKGAVLGLQMGQACVTPQPSGTSIAQNAAAVATASAPEGTTARIIELAAVQVYSLYSFSLTLCMYR